jgi:tetratricopeptide (TPR) repeat protein
MKLSIDCRFVLISALLLFVVCGCTPGGIKTTIDETGQKKIIGYVDADPFFLISITEKIREYVDYSRDEGTILYQPTADETIKLQYLALRKVIVETLLKQPGNKISPSEIIDLSRQIALKRGEEITGKLRGGRSFESISEEYKIPVQLDPVRVLKGNNPGYDKYIWDAQPDVITGPVEYLDRILIFKIVGKGVSEGNDWIDMMIVDFLFPRDEARRELEKKLSEKAEIKITDKYYFALNAYYRDDLDASESALEELGKEKAYYDGMTEYLLARINLKRSEKTPDSAIEKKIESSYLSAIQNSTDIKLKPYFRYELGLFYMKKNDTASAVKEFKEALSELRTDLQLTSLLNDLAIQIGDEEFAKLAAEKIKSLQEIYQSEQVKQPKKDITSPGGISLGDEGL